MDLRDATENLKFDVRMVEMNLKNGSITKEQHKQYLESLSDIADKAQALELEEEASVAATEEETSEVVEAATESAEPSYLQ